jgi:hypothetical protein
MFRLLRIDGTPDRNEVLRGLVEVSLYARVRGTRRRCATRRRSRRAASLATARRAAQITRSIMMTRRTAHTVPANRSVLFLELSGPRHLRAGTGLPTMGRAMTFLDRGLTSDGDPGGSFRGVYDSLTFSIESAALAA